MENDTKVSSYTTSWLQKEAQALIQILIVVHSYSNRYQRTCRLLIHKSLFYKHLEEGVGTVCLGLGHTFLHG